MSEKEGLEASEDTALSENAACETPENGDSHHEKESEKVDFDRGELLAAIALLPTWGGADTTRAYSDYGDLDVVKVQRELRAQVDHILEDNDFSRCEAILTVQAHTLNLIFNKCMQRALDQEQFKGLDIFMRQGLKAQSQCRQTIEALHTMRNPAPSVLKQTNIANGPQQVNNGGNQNDRNELWEGHSGAPVDALEQIDGAQISGGEGQISQEQPKARGVLGGS